LNGLEDNAIGTGVLNILYAGESDKVEVNEGNGIIEIQQKGEQ